MESQAVGRADARVTGPDRAGPGVAGVGAAPGSGVGPAPGPVGGAVAGTIDYDGRRFRPVGPEARPDGPVATYRQAGDLLWADVVGAHGTRRGALCGLVRPDGRLEFGYTLVRDTGEIISGHCVSTPERLPDGRIRLHETWQRYGPHEARGTSQIEELPP